MPRTAARSHLTALRRLGRLYGVQSSYRSSLGGRAHASADSLESALTCMGADVRAPARAERDRQRHLRSRLAPPVAVAWQGRPARIDLRLGRASTGAIDCTMTLEDGTVHEWADDAASLTVAERALPGAAAGPNERITKLRLPSGLPMGYHDLRIRFRGREAHTRVLCAPVTTYRHGHDTSDHEWGVFCPMYAVRRSDDLGAGDLTAFGELAEWLGSMGGRVLATLPLLAVHLADPFDPSPYAPISRLYFNELFIDPRRAQGFASCREAKAALEAAAAAREIESLSRAPLVQYRRQARLRRNALEPLARRFFEQGKERSASFNAFLDSHPDAREFAAFRAVTERRRQGWPAWPKRLAAGGIKRGDYDPEVERYHLFCQYVFQNQFADLARDMKDRGQLVYLDLPVGVRTDGYDVFKNRGLFADGASVGAPPDTSFTSGQDWGFPPILPDPQRDRGYHYLIDSLRAHMLRCDYLRLDHVMAFYRLYWIPPAADATDGVYVRYPDNEAWAVLSIESHRNKCRLVGENLGTVPPQVNRALAKHDVGPLYVAQYESSPSRSAPINRVTRGSVASCNTHDMSPIAAFLDGREIDDRIAVGIFDPDLRDKEHARRLRTRRAMTPFFKRHGLIPTGNDAARNGSRHAPDHDDAEQIRDAIHKWMADSDAEFLLVNIEDLWLETHWQNMPGTVEEHPNWRNRLRYDLGEIGKRTSTARLLKELERLRASRREAPRR